MLGVWLLSVVLNFSKTDQDMERCRGIIKQKYVSKVMIKQTEK